MVQKGRYDRRQANRISLQVLIFVAIAFAAYLAVELSIDPISANQAGVRAFAIFGFSLGYSDIRDVEIIESPAPAMKRILGNDSFGLFREGNFEVAGLGSARVLLKKPDRSYIVVKTDDKNYVLSLGSKDKDQLLYDKIKLGMK
jgi:hypothetical protein